jgi:hypothetical protein
MGVTISAIAAVLITATLVAPAEARQASCFLQADGETHKGQCDLERGTKPGITWVSFGGYTLFIRRERGASVVRQVFEADGRDSVRGTKKGASPCWTGRDSRFCAR